MAGVLTRARAGIVLAAALAAGVVIFALTQGLGQADVPEDDVAVVDADISSEAAGIEDGRISKEGFDRAFAQAAARQGQPEPPTPDNQQYDAIHDEAMGELLDIAWILGEAEERGVQASDREVEDLLEQTKSQSFRSEQEYQQFLRQARLSPEDVEVRLRLQVLSEKIQEEILEDAPQPTLDDAEKFYEANEGLYEQPATRDVRVVVNQDRAKAEQALSRLREDDSDQAWQQVAAQLSTDPSSRNNGGLRESVVEGIFPTPVDREVFSAEEGELLGPIETPNGYYVVQVQSSTPAMPQPFADVAQQIQQQLAQLLQQEYLSSFLFDYQEKWSELTICAEGYLIDRCDNYTAPRPECTEVQQRQTGCPPPVLPSSPGAPGSFAPFTPSAGQPQRPHPPGADPTGPPSVPETIPQPIPGAPQGGG